jgi:hypothetical protein
MAMETRMTATEPDRAQARTPRDADLRRALLHAMRGALRRSVVLLPLDEDDDRLLQQLESVLGLSA